ncbi:hypothetical protein M0G74_14600 [Microbulbifer sp. CAU 1566]|uniref:hypothetical protein n=1 Tax=Microbulbifer sp. CAU 1566 TaxID=2933269 RepID=UPI002005D4C2|nr:hypothetical protein [Microbulbifer sp. CAU 1566]MCK7598508.1 hypothetical protein [Microbulbifer sp. CAU 1566]
MNKFKAFFTFLAFIWLMSCGFLAIHGFLSDSRGVSNAAWFGLLINSWALPVWMLLRYRFSGNFTGDIRESGAFTAVLLGLAIVLLTDTERGWPIYLAIFNLFVLLIYLYHLSALSHPTLPAVNSLFPSLGIVGSGEGVPEGVSENEEKEHWQAVDYCRENQLSGVLLVFLRGSYCADSRNQVHHLRALLPELQRRNVGLVFWSTQPVRKWSQSLLGLNVGQLSGADTQNAPFVTRCGAPFLLQPWIRDAARPSAWLLDAEGYILWRELSVNYRVPVTAESLRSQLFRVED